jgi:predicted nucleic acid-binding protein
MTTYYLDASALIKYYIPERGSEWIGSLLNERGLDGHWAGAVVTSLLSNVEGVCALERAVRSGRIDFATRDVARRRLLVDMRYRFRVLGVDGHLVLRAAGLAERYPLRAYDAVHLAAALTLTESLAQERLAACVLVSADEDLLSAAHAEKLAIANPNDYPAGV